MKELTEMEIAAEAYTEYSRIAGGKSLATGQPLPVWCDLPDDIRYAWHGAIYKVLCLSGDKATEEGGNERYLRVETRRL
jgi:hypothetical protein